MNDEKLECLKYLGNTSEHKPYSFSISKEVPSTDHLKILLY
jgi:hypothetical protein